MVGARVQAEPLQHRPRSPQALARRHARERERKRDVLDDPETRKQVERLEDHADTPAAMAGQGFLVEPREVLAVDTDRPPGRPLETGDDVEKGGLPRAGRPHYGHELATTYAQRDAVQRGDPRVTRGVRPFEADRLDGEWRFHCGQVCPTRATIHACAWSRPRCESPRGASPTSSPARWTRSQ